MAGANGEGAELGEVEGWEIDDLVGRDRLRLLKDLVRHVLWGWTTVRDVVFDTKIRVGASRVVRGGKEDTTIGLVLANNVRCSGGGEDRVLANDELSDTIGRTDLEDGLNGLGREETTVATDDKCLSLDIDRVKDGLDEVLRVMLAIVRG